MKKCISESITHLQQTLVGPASNMAKGLHKGDVNISYLPFTSSLMEHSKVAANKKCIRCGKIFFRTKGFNDYVWNKKVFCSFNCRDLTRYHNDNYRKNYVNRIRQKNILQQLKNDLIFKIKRKARQKASHTHNIKLDKCEVCDSSTK